MYDLCSMGAAPATLPDEVRFLLSHSLLSIRRVAADSFYYIIGFFSVVSKAI